LDTQKGEANTLEGQAASKPPAELKTKVDEIADAAFADDVPSSASQEIMNTLARSVKDNVTAVSDTDGVTSLVGSLTKISGETKHLTNDALTNLSEAVTGLAEKVIATASLTFTTAQKDNVATALADTITGAKDVLPKVSAQEAQFKKVTSTLTQLGTALLKDITDTTIATLNNTQIKASFTRRTPAELAGATTCPGSDATSGTNCVKLPTNGLSTKLEAGCTGSTKKPEFHVIASSYNEFGSSANADDKVNGGAQKISVFCVDTGDNSKDEITVSDLAAADGIKFTREATAGQYVDANSCVFWDASGNGSWSTTGVTGVVAADKKSVECTTTHLTTFSTYDDSTAPTTTPDETTSGNLMTLINSILALVAVFAF